MHSLNRALLVSATALFAAAPMTAWAQATPDYSKVEIKTTDLGNKTFMLEGQGGNITVAVGDDAVLMVDTEFAPLHDKIKAAVTKISALPLKTVINTHYHGDHTGGDGVFAKDGAVVLAHDNVKKRMTEGSTNALTGAKTAPAPDRLPTKTYTGDKTGVELKGRKVQVGHPANAHTDGDTYVFFPDANVLATGDIVSIFEGRYPNIDVGVNGNIKGIIAAVDTYLKLSNDQTKIVPGHGPVLTKARLQEYHDFVVGCRDAVQKAMAGKSEDETVAAKPLAAIDPKVKSTQEASDNFVRLIYKSLKT
ncbi:MAG: MBL fold metallo-hydrolase [Rhodospirillaceae bacterium]|nr:MBL fold metallo-hydrolase [Rhodospirillaceae bacterium]